MKNFFRTILSRSALSSNFPRPLYRKADLPSIKESVVAHESQLNGGKDFKGMFTSDPSTIDLARGVMRKGGSSQFFESNFFVQPNRSDRELGSLLVRFSDITDFPDFRHEFENNAGRNVMLCVGGPAAEDQTVLAAIISEVRARLDGIVYATRDYKESNANHSAMQSHARHGTALNADRNLTGHALLPVMMMRNLIGMTPEDTLDPDYKKIDVKFTIDPTKLRVYFGNELNWLKQEYKRLCGQMNEHDINRLESMLSQEILNVVEEQMDAQLSGGAKKAQTDSSSIHVALNRRDVEITEHENEELKKIGITAQELTKEEKEFFFNGNNVVGAWRYVGDTHLQFDIHKSNQEFALQNDVRWLDGTEISRVMLNKTRSGEAEVVGVVTANNEYIYANKVHLTGGYKVAYVFDNESDARFRGISLIRSFFNKIEDGFQIQGPLPTPITTSTGVSVNALFKKSEKMRRIIDKYGHTGEIAVTNSHWTMIAHDEDHVVMRMTGGGNTGSEEYNPAYFLNLLANTRQIFGDDLIGVLSTYGCPRAVNARNSTEFVHFAKGGIISYGKGGTGNTKRHAEAALGLMMLGFEQETIDYFNQFQGRKGQPLGDELAEVYKHVCDVKFVHDGKKRTNRRMGYDQSLSASEMISIGLLIAALSFSKSKKKENESGVKVEEIDDEEEVKETKIKPLGARNLAPSLQLERQN